MTESVQAHTGDDVPPIKRLLDVMQQLRNPEGGCPWDLEQTYASLAPYTVEEAYEVADAAERGDLSHLKEELGDLLLQVVFYAQLASEERVFRFDDICEGIVEKLVRRHPHVFKPSEPKPEEAALLGADDDSSHEKLSADDVAKNWEKIKMGEKGRVPLDETRPFDEIPENLPSLTRARKIQKAAKRLGFDWPDVSGPVEKLGEEVAELVEAIQANACDDAVVEELGDVLFSCVNISRHLKVDPEQVLRSANRKFEKRFAWVLGQVHGAEKKMTDMRPDALEILWQRAKAQVDNR